MTAWVIRTLSRFRGRLAVMLVIQLAIAAGVSCQPLLFGRLLSPLADGVGPDTVAAAMPTALVLCGVFAVIAAAHAANGTLAARFSSDLLRHLQGAVFSKTAELPLRYFRSHAAGEFFTRFNHDVGQAQRFLADVVPRFVRDGVTALALVVVLAWACPPSLVAAVLAVTAAATGLTWWIHRLIERYAVRQRAAWSEINRTFDETVRGIDTLKTFGAEARQGTAFDSRTSAMRDLSVWAGERLAAFSPGIELTGRIGSVALVLLGIALLVSRKMDLDVFVLFLFCSAMFQASTASMMQLYTQMPPQLVGLENLWRFFEESGEHDDSETDAGRTIDRPLEIVFHDLRFAHPGGRELYGGASFTFLSPGVTLLRGPNGSGKSTLFHLLLRFDAPLEGDITLGGEPLASFSRRELRTRIGVVTQYHHVFDDTLRENLLIANPDATDEELLRALEVVGLRSTFEGSNVLDQRPGRDGMRMSGGERQRLCIARLLVRSSPILILDEPWSNLDPEGQRVLGDVIDELRARCSVIVVSHRDPAIDLAPDHEISLCGPCRPAHETGQSGAAFAPLASLNRTATRSDRWA